MELCEASKVIVNLFFARLFFRDVSFIKQERESDRHAVKGCLLYQVTYQGVPKNHRIIRYVRQGFSVKRLFETNTVIGDVAPDTLAPQQPHSIMLLGLKASPSCL